MLQSTVARLSELWPGAHIEVLTDSASNLARHCPAASQLSRPDFACWLNDHFFIGRFHRYLPKRALDYLDALKQWFGFRWPSLMGALTDARLRFRDAKRIGENLRSFREVIKTSDLMAVCGAGGFADSCKEWNLFILGAMSQAIAHGKAVVMFGQGIGPLSDTVVLSWAKHVLPKVRLIGLRGTKGDKELLEAVGVHPSRMVTTGDDTLELANLLRETRRRDGIGVNLRVAFYSDVDAELTERVGSVLRNLAKHYGAALIPVPIAFHECANDRETIRRLLKGFDGQSDGGADLDTPRKIMEQTARCRVVVTGAYHAAVFALAQGIPVVCLSNSPYYSAKFEGLAELFGAGCTTIMLNDPDLDKAFRAAIEQAWTSADEVQSSLLNSAGRQIETGRTAYASIWNQCEYQVQKADSKH